jgi:hypothetical protein
VQEPVQEPVHELVLDFKKKIEEDSQPSGGNSEPKPEPDVKAGDEAATQATESPISVELAQPGADQLATATTEGEVTSASPPDVAETTQASTEIPASTESTGFFGSFFGGPEQAVTEATPPLEDAPAVTESVPTFDSTFGSGGDIKFFEPGQAPESYVLPNPDGLDLGKTNGVVVVLAQKRDPVCFPATRTFGTVFFFSLPKLIFSLFYSHFLCAEPFTCFVFETPHFDF